MGGAERVACVLAERSKVTEKNIHVVFLKRRKVELPDRSAYHRFFDSTAGGLALWGKGGILLRGRLHDKGFS
jgi:hypothetical protein